VVASLDGVAHLDPGPGPNQRTVAVTGSAGSVITDSHLGELSPRLVEGQRVSIGDQLGTVGGPVGDGDPSRIHFDIRAAQGQCIDPVPYLDRWVVRALVSV